MLKQIIINAYNIHNINKKSITNNNYVSEICDKNVFNYYNRITHISLKS